MKPSLSDNYSFLHNKKTIQISYWFPYFQFTKITTQFTNSISKRNASTLDCS